MKQFLTGFLMIGFSLNIFAEADPLEIIRRVAKSYYQLGEDNNYLDQTVINGNDFNTKLSENISSHNEMIAAIKQCIFMREGANGFHLSLGLQDRISHHLATVFHNLLPNKSIYRMPIAHVEIGSGIFNSPCVVAVQDHATGRVLLMTGAAMD